MKAPTLPMDEIPLPQLMDFLHEAISCCRTNASFSHVPEFARVRLSEAADHTEFFMERREFRRALREAVLATRLNTAVARYIQASATAVDTLREHMRENVCES